MKVSILTLFHGLSESYSLVNVVAEQLEMLLQGGTEVTVIVAEDCPDSERFGIFRDDRIVWVKLSHQIGERQIRLFDYSDAGLPLHDTFEEESDFLAAQLVAVLAQCDVCILHDLLYLGIYYLYNMAVRKAQPQLPQVRFLAFCHSFPLECPNEIPPRRAGLFSPMERTTFVYPSGSGIPALAKQYRVPESQCRVVYNTTPLIRSCCEAVQTLHRQVDLLDTRLLVIYPARFSVGKRFEKVAALCGCLKRVGNQTIKVIFCDAPAAEGEPEPYKKAVTMMGLYYGLDPADLVFTSEQGFPQGFPRQGVLDLFSLSNLFICPSFSEAFSLTTLEAAQKGNFLVLNQSVAALQELGSALHAHFMQWDALCEGHRHKQSYPDGERAYYEKQVAPILREMYDAPLCHAKTMIRTRYNSRWVWNNQLKALIFGESPQRESSD